MNKEELKQKRIDLGLTQTDLAKELDVTNNTVARWESGVLPKIPKMLELAMQAVEMNRGKGQTAPVIAPESPVVAPESKSRQSAKADESKPLDELPALDDKDDLWLSTKEAAEYTNRKPRTVRDFFNKEGLPRVEITGKGSFVKLTDLTAFLKNRRENRR